MTDNPPEKEKNKLYKTSLHGNVVVLEFQHYPLKRMVQIREKERIFSLLREIENHEDIKILVLINSHKKMEKESYIEFIRASTQNHLDMTQIMCFYNAINQLVLRMIHFNKIIIHVDNGVVLPPFMNISLACDYRIVGDKTVFRNPNIELDLPPKGAGILFLSKILGYSKTIEFFMSEKDVTAEEALQMGIVNKVVASEDLKEQALVVAQEFAKKPMCFMAGIKQLLNWDYDEIKRFLDYEDEVLLKSIRFCQE